MNNIKELHARILGIIDQMPEEIKENTREMVLVGEAGIEDRVCIVRAEEGEQFQQYRYKNGDKVPKDTIVGIEVLENADKNEWILFLSPDIVYVCEEA